MTTSSDDTVVPIGRPRQADPAAPGSPDAAQRPDPFVTLERYWLRVAAGRIMPHRDEIDPRALSGILDRVFLLERMAPGVARFRLAGERLNGLLDMDMRGLPLTSLFFPASRDGVNSSVRALFDDPARIDMTLDGPREGRRGRVAARLLILPLRDRDGAVTRAIGCLSAGGATIKAPQRFDIVAEARQTLLGYGTLPDPAVHATKDAPNPMGPARPYLRLVVDNI
ncbi:PAS domain-containing protein [Palleronia salina]|uniref:PAS domain-containing protein n=1 Tax=Palleronia salina TaxID=313368 RepID=A0A1M6AV95_9RHOB|nr:PAS domain-containing protein [Palleronia salina]SHI40469.1 PAS domain-containing protein [Palleronia salina]